MPVLFLKGFRFDKAADGSGAHRVLRRGGGAASSAGSENLAASEAAPACVGGTKPAHTPSKERKARAVLGGDIGKRQILTP